MSNTKDKTKVIITCPVEIDRDEYEGVIKDVLLNVDVFNRGYCGYWALGVTSDIKLGWLVYEQVDDPRPSDEECKRMEKLWRAGKPLPDRWHRLNREAAEKAVAIGLSRFGLRSFENAWDANDIDAIVQRTLLGELRYG